MDRTVDWLDELPLDPGPPWLAMGTRGLDGDRWARAWRRAEDD